MNRVFVVIRELPYKRASLCNCSVLKGEVVNQEPAIRRTLNGKLEPKVRYEPEYTLWTQCHQKCVLWTRI